MNWNIRSARTEDEPIILRIIHAAFGDEEGPEISVLVSDLQKDQSARPALSLVATNGRDIVGHILFTATHLKNLTTKIKSSILAPLAVHPEYQKKGIGSQLIKTGFERLQKEGVGLVFVLGDPAYYQRHGFTAAGPYGLEAPHPLPKEYFNAWMVKELRPGVMKSAYGVVSCANALGQRKYWL
ncbi:N-acetyltransferase [Pseudodesulfovibrio sp.]|uniref:GNAT family N-acetyltransferase n=1 Tax=Pseudodesulfovibrio sp. TaxID=2035812 RepID=UPI00262E9E20|nr:N-acetyltransferase [Pseudodesulfovibrio sp.]MDD3313420.1 N-acetyltransferase [Pseudodesulfovibrio sp.]